MSTKENDNKVEGVKYDESFGTDSIEAPKYSCALGGAYGAAVGVYGLVPLLHSGLGCGLGHLFGQFYAGGQNAGGPVGGTSTPTSGLVEEHVIFGGEDKLRKLIEAASEVMEGEALAVISGCIPALIGDDVEAVIREYPEIPILNINAPGFSGNTYEGYELFFEAVVDQLLEEQETEKGVVNIFGVVPYQHLFWKGELNTVKQLLESIGLKPNIIFTEFDGVEKLREISKAEYNIVLSTWNGHRVARKLEEKFAIPYITFPGVPVGAKQTTNFLRKVGEKLNLPEEEVEGFIAQEERRTYRFVEYAGDGLLIARPHSYFAVLADSNAAISVTNFLVNEVGLLPDIIEITDSPPEEYHEEIIKNLTETLDTIAKPDIVFEPDSYQSRENLRGRPFQFLFASSLEANSTEELETVHITIAFPSYNRTVLDTNYAGYGGGLRLIEDFTSTFAGPL